MRGRPAISIKRLLRRGGALSAIAIMLGSLSITQGATADTLVHVSEGGNGTYLALGDSVAFGYTPPAVTTLAQYENPNNFVSYANYVASSLNLKLTNASCPGETTLSMIDPLAISNGCENSLGQPPGYRTYFPLHVQYSGSQLAYAVGYLKSHPHTRLVTIDIGANDAFVCQAITEDFCTSPSEFKAVLDSVSTNLATIYSAIRNQAHYHHALVALDYYSTSYTNQAQVALTEALNSAIIQPTLAAGGLVANGFSAFEVASQSYGGNPCAAGLLIKLPTGRCNIHPTLLGHQVLAQAVIGALAGHHSQ
ncbi:MAG: SGNH/GDSL hydrolase family protein [Acidimicrobiaceae bacterium]|nr:SGNH/GDSL hydrolase family protein [Acidimicrobiaceae bacterium]